MVERQKRQKSDIFAWPLIGFMFKNRRFIIGLRLITTLMLFSAIYFGFVYPTQEENPFTTALFWALFWPFFMVLTLPTLGAVFCGVCPHGFIGRYLTRWGLKKSMPTWLKNPYISLIILITFYWFTLYAFPGLLKTPWISALFFALLTILAFSFYFIFKDMAYCKYICPIGPLTKAYGKSSFTWLSTYEESCSSCKTFECAKACTHKLSPFLFDKHNSMGDCTLCMDCADSCEAVRFSVKKPSFSLWRRLKKPKMIDIWVYVLILAVATIAMRFHHALGRTAIAPEMPWYQLGSLLKSATGIYSIDWIGFSAFSMALIITISITFGSYYGVSKIASIDYKKVVMSLGYALAPLMLLGAFEHVLSSFFYHYAQQSANAYLWLIGQVPDAAPLATRKDQWLRIFSIFPILAALWSALILYRRVKLLELTRAKQWAAFISGGAIIWFYLFLLIFTAYAFAHFGAIHHHH